MTGPSCPDLERLFRFLELPSAEIEDEDEAIAGHVEGCAACRAELERLAASSELSAIRKARTGHEVTADLPFLRDLKALDLRHLSDPPAPRKPAESPRPEIPGYEILGELGRGGAGVVFHARHRTLNRPVAIKMLNPSLFPTEADRRRLRAEAEAVARLQHPNVVQLYEIGEAGGSPYLVLEYVSGGTLDAYLAGRPEPPREAAALVETLARAVHAAHQKQIVHRDLKPANILLQREAPAVPGDSRAENGTRRPHPSSLKVPKITDFGLAKQLDRSLSGLTQTLSGTPAYMSPEQVPERSGEPSAKPVTPATDVYALGVILYEMVTGRPPFLGTDWVTTLLQVIRRAPVPPRELQPGTPRDLETICLKCLEKEPGRRYATAGELAADLGRFLDHEPIWARPVGPLGRLIRWGRRNPAAAGLLGALLLTGLLAFMAILWQWGKAERARQVADALARSESAANEQREVQRKKAVEAQAQAERALDEAQRRGESERRERYRANIAAAAAALQLQNSSTAARALEAAPEEYRDWEWRHLHSQLDSALAVLPGGPPPWESSWQRPLITPSGERLATLGKDLRTINLWDATTGNTIGVLSGHEGPVLVLASSPDGKRLASGSEDRTIRVWDLASGKEQAVLRGHEKPVKWLAYSPDGERICSLDQGSGRLWDATTCQTIAVFGGSVSHISARFLPDRRIILGLEKQLCIADAITGREMAVLGGHQAPIVQLAVSPDGRRIASHGKSEKIIRLWDGVNGREIATLRGDVEYQEALAFSPDGSRLVSGSVYPDNMVRLWDAATGESIAEMQGHKNTIISVAFDPEFRRIVSASRDQTARLCDGLTGELIAPLRGHTESVWYADFSPDGKRLVTASNDQTLRLWDATSGDLVAVLRGHKAELMGATFAAHGSRLVSRSDDGESRIWDMELAERNGILRGHVSFVYDVAFSPDGTRAASAAWDGTVRLWDVTTGRQTALLRHDQSHSDPTFVASVAWHPNGSQLASVTRDDTITLWDLATGKPRHVFTAPTGQWTGDARAVFNPAGTLLAAGSRDGTVRLWDVVTGKPAGELHGHEGPALEAAFSPDGNQIASVGYDRTVRLWDVSTHALVKVLPGVEGYRMAYSKDGRLLAVGTQSGHVHLWDARTYQELADLPHHNRVLGLAFNPSGTRLATGCGDNTIRLWDLATWQEVCELRGHESYVHALSFSPDGTRLASASGDFTVRIWDTVLPSVRARPPDASFLPH
jgi:WD40 repeat protein/serine/threonine protein kinase